MSSLYLMLGLKLTSEYLVSSFRYLPIVISEAYTPVQKQALHMALPRKQ